MIKLASKRSFLGFGLLRVFSLFTPVFPNEATFPCRDSATAALSALFLERATWPEVRFPTRLMLAPVNMKGQFMELGSRQGSAAHMWPHHLIEVQVLVRSLDLKIL